jgi:hypothetical protein
MPFSLELVNKQPYKTKPYIKSVYNNIPIDNYDVNVVGFGELVRAAKQHHLMDVLMNDDILGRTTTVELILGSYAKYACENTKRVIRVCIDTFSPIVDEYANALKDYHIYNILESRPVYFNMILKELINAPVWKACIPYTLLSKYLKYSDQVVGLFKDVLRYIISQRKAELECNTSYLHNITNKIFTSVYLVDRYHSSYKPSSLLNINNVYDNQTQVQNNGDRSGNNHC